MDHSVLSQHCACSQRTWACRQDESHGALCSRMQRTCMPPSGAPCCVGMENRSSDSAIDGCAGLLDAAVLPAAAPGAPKACANGSALCCMAGAALGAGELSCAKGSAACINTSKPLRESIDRRALVPCRKSHCEFRESYKTVVCPMGKS